MKSDMWVQLAEVPESRMWEPAEWDQAHAPAPKPAPEEPPPSTASKAKAAKGEAPAPPAPKARPSPNCQGDSWRPATTGQTLPRGATPALSGACSMESCSASACTACPPVTSAVLMVDAWCPVLQRDQSGLSSRSCCREICPTIETTLPVPAPVCEACSGPAGWVRLPRVMPWMRSLHQNGLAPAGAAPPCHGNPRQPRSLMPSWMRMPATRSALFPCLCRGL